MERRKFLIAAALMLAGCKSTSGEPKPALLPQPTAVPTETGSLTEKRQYGIDLQNLNFDMAPPSRIVENGRFLRVGKFSFSNVSEDYDLMLNPQQILQTAVQCGVYRTNVGFFIQTGDEIIDPSSSEQPLGIETSIINSTVSIAIGLRNFSRSAEEELDLSYEVDPDRRALALTNLTTIILNRSLIQALCGNVAGIEAAPRMPSEAILRQSDTIADGYATQLFRGQAEPMLVVRQKIKNPI